MLRFQAMRGDRMTEDGRAGSGTDRERWAALVYAPKARVRELESASREAIAVVGLGLRLPVVSSMHDTRGRAGAERDSRRACRPRVGPGTLLDEDAQPEPG